MNYDVMNISTLIDWEHLPNPEWSLRLAPGKLSLPVTNHLLGLRQESAGIHLPLPAAGCVHLSQLNKKKKF